MRLSLLSQAPEGAPLPRQGPNQRVHIQRPGIIASRSRNITTTVVSAVKSSDVIN